jgi:hypothetical protein
MISFKKISTRLFSLLLLAMVSFNFVSCREDEFDEPPLNGTDPNLTVNMTIDSLKRLYSDSIINFNKIITIDSNWVIAGVVTADDKSGNYYKTMVIEDATAGISIRLDMSDFNVEYPIGRRVYVKLKGLVMGDYGELIQIGGYIDNTGTSPEAAPIPLGLVKDYLIGGQYGLNPQPTKVTMNDLNNTDKWQNRFIEIENVEFDPADTAQPFADAVLLQSVNRFVNDCNGGSIIVRTSGYCNFASVLTPTKKGTIKGIFSIYNSDLQLILRDSNDVDMDSLRCNGAGGPANLINISDVRNLYSGSTINVNGSYYINGVVTSDRTTGNLNGRNLFIQDATGGICVRFSANHSFNIGDSLSIVITGQSLGEFSGLLQLGTSTPNVAIGNATILGTGKSVTPQVVTVAQILANMAANDSWESSLLKINNATITSSTSTTTYSGSIQINDGTGVMTLYTASGASFAGTTFPTGTVSITGNLTDYGGTVTAPNTNAQMQLRSTTDVQ